MTTSFVYRLFLFFTIILISIRYSSVMAEVVSGSDTELEGISVTGSNYLPQVLYIVPWQPPSYQKKAEHPPNKTLSGIIKPIEPTFHNNDYYFRKRLEVKFQALNNDK